MEKKFEAEEEAEEFVANAMEAEDDSIEL